MYLIVGSHYFVFTMVNVIATSLTLAKRSAVDLFPLLGSLRGKMMIKKENVPETAEFLNLMLKRMLGTNNWKLK